MKAENYAKALFEAGKNGTQTDVLMRGLIRSLKGRGAMRLLPHILTQYERLAARLRRDTPILTIARESDRADAVQASGASAATTVVVDERIIGGYRLEEKGVLKDASFKRHLLEVYRRVRAQ